MSDRYVIRRMLIEDHDPRDATVHYATEGLVDAVDLWWLHDTYRLMAPADAWLLVAMWQDELDQALVDRTLANPSWWRWFDRGQYDARDQP